MVTAKNQVPATPFLILPLIIIFLNHRAET